jgi:hypothetical protein
MVFGNKTKDASHEKDSLKKSKKIMAVPHPDKNWRHKNGVWYYVKESEKTHKGDYHSKFLLPAIRKWRQARKKTIGDKNKKKHT